MDEYRDTIINKPISTALWSPALPMMLESVVLTILNLPTCSGWETWQGSTRCCRHVGMLMITISQFIRPSIGVIAIVLVESGT